VFLFQIQTGLFGAKPTGFGTPTTGLFGQPCSTGFSFTQTQPQSTLGGSLFGAKTTASTGFGGFGATGTTGFSTLHISVLYFSISSHISCYICTTAELFYVQKLVFFWLFNSFFVLLLCDIHRC